ncbi:MAG: PKD domain-containing protein, partial [Cytophagaceae bacterium]
ASPLTATSNTITMNVTASVTPAASIAITSGSNPTCSGSSVTFTATPTNGGTAPTYLWRINGANVGTGATLTRNNLNNGDQVSCVLTSNATCASAATATSNTITMTVNPLPNTSAISGNSNPACNATGITYSVTGGTNSTYVWTVPSGAQITGSATGNSITVNFGSSNGNITVRETSQAGCQGPQRQLAINLTGCSMVANFTASPTTICRNETVTFTNTSTGVTTGATYSWNFGAGASPGTANGAGPHQVIYTTSGSKTVSLQIVNGATVSETKTNYIQVTDVAQAYAGNNQSITTTTTTMAANQPSAGMGIGTWTEVSSSGSVVFANPNSATSNVSGLGQGANLLRWTITNANCSTFAEVTITVNNLVIDGPSTVVPNQIYSFSIDGGANSSYNWLLPQGATLVTGQGTGSVDISFSSGFTGTISVTVVNNGTSTTISKEISAIVTGQQSSSAKGSVTLYPNPCENKSLLKYETADVQKMDIRIFDQKGVTLYSESGLWTNEYIEIGEGLPAGVWFVQVSTADKIEIIKVVKLQ